jgi:hypothetical protein
VTIRRRGISLVAGYMLMNSDTSTMIGIAFSATAIGVASSLRSRKRINRNADPTPSNVPAIRPTSAFLPDTKAASLMRLKLSKNAFEIALGAGRKYGLRSNACTANSHTSRNPMPNTAGATSASRTRRIIDPRPLPGQPPLPWARPCATPRVPA